MVSHKNNNRILFISTLFTLFLLFFSQVALPATASKSTITPDQSPGVINIITRHESGILDSFAEGFLASSFAQDIGYTTSDKNKIVFWTVQTTQGWQTALGRTGEGAMDLAWGGGPPLFDSMIEANLLQPINNLNDQDLMNLIDAQVPTEVAGVEMTKISNSDLMWAANVISSFGFTVNNKVLADFGLEKPSTWEELASPDFFVDENIASIAMGNPPETTSNTRIYQIILQQFGWERGWEILMSMAGNGAIFGGSLATRAGVIQEQVAVSMTIDFYGVYAATECSDCEYVIPTDGTAINGDPIAVAANMINPEAAAAFMKYTFSDEGQSLWIKNDRLPIAVGAFNTPLGQTRPDVAELYNVTLTNQGIDFDDDLALATLETTIEYFDSTISDIHADLKIVWSELVNSFKDGTITRAEFDAKVTELAAPQLTLDEAKVANTQIKSSAQYKVDIKNEWLETARTRYIGSSEDDSPFPALWSFFSIVAIMMVISILRKKRT
ncbi:MAG: Phosphoglycerate transport regulatory protein PgtC precursor [Candidatus Heimdallarchaeota archaeon LC_2]|nr:MAG: Phosphoglycerate transport regulatory protein PgtC precursor [Candidatus Heimdallarchaeota archaeon LC_2]